jgi:hypothetical protein
VRAQAHSAAQASATERAEHGQEHASVTRRVDHG